MIKLCLQLGEDDTEAHDDFPQHVGNGVSKQVYDMSLTEKRKRLR